MVNRGSNGHARDPGQRGGADSEAAAEGEAHSEGLWPTLRTKVGQLCQLWPCRPGGR